MQVREVMTAGVDLDDPNTSLQDAARMMRDDDVGAIPVAENDRLVGMLTDRDIVVRCVADGKDTEASSEALEEISQPSH